MKNRTNKWRARLLAVLLSACLICAGMVQTAWAEERYDNLKDYFFPVYNSEPELVGLASVVHDAEKGYMAFTNKDSKFGENPSLAAIWTTDKKAFALKYKETVNENYLWKVEDMEDGIFGVLESVKPVQGQHVFVCSFRMEDDELGYFIEERVLDDVYKNYADGSAHLTLNKSVDLKNYPAIVMSVDVQCIGIMDHKQHVYCDWFDKDTFYGSGSSGSSGSSSSGSSGSSGSGGFTQMPRDTDGGSATDLPEISQTAEQSSSESSQESSVSSAPVEDTSAAEESAPKQKDTDGRKTGPLPVIIGAIAAGAAVVAVVVILLLRRGKKPGKDIGGNRSKISGKAVKPTMHSSQVGRTKEEDVAIWDGDAVQTNDTPVISRGTVPVTEGPSPARAEDTEKEATLCLECTSGPLKGSAYPITGTLLIGRDPECTVKFPDAQPGVSRKHAALTMEEGFLMLTDTSSTGTVLERLGTKLPKDKPVQVQEGDVIFIGEENNSFKIISI